METAADIVGQLSRSQIFLDYEKAFAGATELPLHFAAAGIAAADTTARRGEANPLCVVLAESSETCKRCLRGHRHEPGAHGGEFGTVTCFAGVCETSIPVRVGEKVIGFLQTGGVALRAPSARQFRSVATQVLAWGANVDLKRVEDAYYHSRVLPKEKYAAMVKLIEIFSKHLSIVANQLSIEASDAEPPLVRRARAYIAEHQREPVDLKGVAKAVHVSTFYFCKMFKRSTGLTFTDYLNRVRVERAREHLLKPHVRVSEVAYEVGFHSLTHFNRSFLRIVGQSPTVYRRNRLGVRAMKN